MRDLGVLFDSELTMKKRIAKVAAVCFFHIRRLRQIRRRVGKDVTISLVLALITPRLDYCNSVNVEEAHCCDLGNMLLHRQFRIEQNAKVAHDV